MPHIIYGGLKYLLVRHAVYCKSCKNTVESKYGYDFKMCPCGLIGVDGGISDGNRVLGDLSMLEDRSMYRADINGKRFWLPVAGLN